MTMTTTPPSSHGLSALDQYLTLAQRQRALALHEARTVLRTPTGAFSSKPLDVVELIEVAQWIIDGVDPWADDDSARWRPQAEDEAGKVPIPPFGTGGVGYMTRGHIHEPKGRAG